MNIVASADNVYSMAAAMVLQVSCISVCHCSAVLLPFTTLSMVKQKTCLKSMPSTGLVVAKVPMAALAPLSYTL